MAKFIRKNVLLLTVTFVGLAAFGAFVGWAFYISQDLSGGWGSLESILPIVIVCLILVGGLTGVLMWLAFYSSREGYDEPLDLGGPKR